ncbi:MAG: hypothetical protein JWL73_1080 [Actinomycetia bacterium]|nr:hypothetical protein [Actinomycetes bacterium]
MLAAVLIFVVLLVIGLGLIGWLILRGSKDTSLSEADFDQAYEDLPESERPDAGNREEAWKDFSNWRKEQEPQHDDWPEDDDQL